MIWTSLIAQGKRQQLMSILLAVLLAFIYFYLARFYRTSGGGWILGIGWVIVIGNLLRALLGGLYRWDRQPFRRFDLGLRDDRARPGQAFHLELVLQAKRSTKLARLSVELRCFDEKITKGRERELLHEQRRIVIESLSVAPNGSHRFEVELPIPLGAPSTFRDSGNRIRWEIAIDADVLDWGVLRDEFGVTVTPS
ncbi:MAG TPA: hypothetical protein VGC53_18610 [Vicinamibacteria bacterium]|jgi:hypothetical protein